MTSATAYAHTNIALIKYWGKADVEQNIPATGSLSLTLDCFGTKTSVTLGDSLTDRLTLNQKAQEGLALDRVSRFLDRVRLLAGSQKRCHVESLNDVPTASGLASSASAFAALALAATKAYGVQLSEKELSLLARYGSGSAARSVFGGFALMHGGQGLSSEECYAKTIASPSHFQVAMVVAQCSNAQKKVSSSEAMLHTAKTSPYYQAWIDTHSQDLTNATHAVSQGDIKLLGQLMEHSTLKMHACMHAARPAINYLNDATLRVMEGVRKLRSQGANCYFTMDAGPHVKVLCPQNEAETIGEELASLSGVIRVDIARPGPGARVMQR